MTQLGWNRTSSRCDWFESVKVMVPIATNLAKQEGACWKVTALLLESGLGKICQTFRMLDIGARRHVLLSLSYLIGQFITCMT